ncbi:MAG TPA: CHAT domain-containing protein [Vicinamibacterales bacterium]|nr:CHAT domain-containing protein [Vicinamibacterales bacterium]
MAKRTRRSPETSPDSAPPPISAPAPLVSEQAIVVARGRQRRLDVTLVRGSILDVPARALVLGLFRNVDPGGAAKAIDIRLSGALTELMRSRTVSPEAGSVFVLPTARTGLLVEMVIFAGLGPFDRFNSSVIQLVASNLVRTLVRGNVEEFSAVLFGGGSGFDVRECAQHLLGGVVGSLRDVDPHQRFRGFTICELDEAKFNAIRDQIYAGCREEFCRDVDVVVRERRLSVPEPVRRPAAGAKPSAVEAEPLYLLVRSDAAAASTLGLRCAVLTSGSKAAVLEGVCEIPRQDLEKELGFIEEEKFDTAALKKLGQRLAKLALPESVRAELAKSARRHVAVVHDLEAARLPWECLELDGWVPALTNGMSRRYVANNLAVGRWTEHREHDRELSLLLIVDPTSNLPGAVRESESIRQLVAADPRVRVTTLTKGEATKAAVLAHFRSERFDAIHYAGHAQFDAQTVGESGIVCADGTLRAVDLLNLRSLPGLMFFNACESGRLRRRSAQSGPSRAGVHKKLTEAVGFAESFMRYGVMNYVGTYWPVGDDSAAGFARAFYGALINGQSIGEALIGGRQAVQKTDSVDWADYIHYGDPRFTLKKIT